MTSPEDPPEAEYCTKKNPNESGSGERTGWSEVQDVLNILRAEVKDLWYRTGRANFYREMT